MTAGSRRYADLKKRKKERRHASDRKCQSWYFMMECLERTGRGCDKAGSFNDRRCLFDMRARSVVRRQRSGGACEIRTDDRTNGQTIERRHGSPVPLAERTGGGVGWQRGGPVDVPAQWCGYHTARWVGSWCGWMWVGAGSAVGARDGWRRACA